MVRWTDGVGTASIAWESVGTTTVGGATIDRYVLHYGGGLLMPLVHVRPAASDRAGPRPVVLDVGLDGKAGPGDWPWIKARLDAGMDVVSFDLRGTGELRMRYRASGDDPALAPSDQSGAYANPLSGVLANHVYNSLLTGRPYFLEMIEDVEIAARFSRAKLGATKIVAAGRGDAVALALAASEVLDGVEWLPEPGVAPFVWSEAVESLAETWPIQYLMPGGAFIR